MNGQNAKLVKFSAGGQNLYMYQNKLGESIVVDSLSKVPKALRKHMKHVDVAALSKTGQAQETLSKNMFASSNSVQQADQILPASSTVKPSQVLTTQALCMPASAKAFVNNLHWPSVGMGLAIGILLVVFGKHLFKKTWFFKFGLTAAVLLLGMSLYLGMMRKKAGLGNAPLANPTAIVQDAKDVAGQMNEQLAEQEKLLEQIAAEP